MKTYNNDVVDGTYRIKANLTRTQFAKYCKLRKAGCGKMAALKKTLNF